MNIIVCSGGRVARQSAAVGLMIKDDKLRPTYRGSNPLPSFHKS